MKKSAERFLHVDIGTERKKFLKQYCLDNSKKIKEAVCEMIDAMKKENDQCSKK